MKDRRLYWMGWGWMTVGWFMLTVFLMAFPPPSKATDWIALGGAVLLIAMGGYVVLDNQSSEGAQ